MLFPLKKLLYPGPEASHQKPVFSTSNWQPLLLVYHLLAEVSKLVHKAIFLKYNFSGAKKIFLPEQIFFKF